MKNIKRICSMVLSTVLICSTIMSHINFSYANVEANEETVVANETTVEANMDNVVANETAVEANEETVGAKLSEPAEDNNIGNVGGEQSSGLFSACGARHDDGEELIKDVSTDSEAEELEFENEYNEETEDVSTDNVGAKLRELAEDSVVANADNVGSNTDNVGANVYGARSENVSSPSEIDDEVITDLSQFENNYIYEEIEEDELLDKNKKSLFGALVIPEKFDLRDYTNEDTGLSYVPPIRRQASGDCWTFGTIAMFESNIRKQGLVDNEEDSNLSEVCVSYFTYGMSDVNNNDEYKGQPGVQGYDYTTLSSSTNFAKKGGTMYNSTLAASSYQGAVIEDENSSYQNLADEIKKDSTLKNFSIDPDYAYNKNGFVLKNAYYIGKSRRDYIKQLLMENGAIGIVYYGETDHEDYYAHKNENDQWCYFTDQSSYNHAISVVGWDDTIPASDFYSLDKDGNKIKQATEPGAWLCRNSWGKYSTSNDGYFWLSYEEGSLGSTFFSVEAMEADKYKFNYHYDSTGYGGSDGRIGGSTSNKPKFANVYQVSGDDDQTLDAVSVAVGSTDSEFNIMIYTKDTKMDSPIDGTKQLTQSASKDVSGVYTIELDKKIFLKKGSYYSIVIEGIAGNAGSTSNYFRLYYDDYATSNNVNFRNAAELGQSFYYTGTSATPTIYDINIKTDGKSMTNDLTEVDGITYGRNWRIKGLANIAPKVTFNNGTGEGDDYYQSFLPGAEFKLDSNKFTKTGYKFANWKDSAGHTYDDNADIVLDDEVTLEAQWTPITYTITYNANGGTVTPASVTKTYDTNVTLATPVKDNYDFKNWCTDDTLSTPYDGTTDLSTTENDNVVIYAQYSAAAPVQYTITYKPGEGEGDMPSQNVDEGDDAILNENKFTKSGYSFDYWTDEDGNKYNDKQNIGKITNNLVLTANWKKDPDPAPPTPPTPTPTPSPTPSSGGNNTGGSSSSGVSSDGGSSDSSSSIGPISTNQNVNNNLLYNTNQSNNKNISTNTTSVNVNDVVWTKDNLTGKWKLDINSVLTGKISAKDGFVQIVSTENGVSKIDTYCFDTNGNMLVGWVQTSDKNWYYMDSNPKTLGLQIKNSWKDIDGKFYYFDSNGKLLVNAVAPNNMPVDENGALIDPTGLFSSQLRIQNF